MKNNSSLTPCRNILLAVALLTVAFLPSCNPGSTGNTSKIHFSDSVQHEADRLSERIFFLLHEIKGSLAMKKALTKNRVFIQYQKQERDSILKAIDECADMNCLVQALTISDDENQTIIQQLSDSYQKNKGTFQKFINKKIRPSHAYILNSSLSDSAFLIEAWKQQKQGINYILHGYLQNKGLHYASIDSAMYDVHSAAYLDTVKQTISAVLTNDKKQQLFFQSALDICIKILQLNNRNEAARFIPLPTVNKKAYAQIAQIKWKKYPFSGILIFGSGPSKPDVAINPTNKERCRMGAALYKQNKAPFIIVSGGFVHPFQTKFNEAFEMKKYITDSLDIPANVIIMEPHARHTTGNVRNANRIILRQHIPFDKPVLGVSSRSHINYIAADRFKKACKRDFGFIPFKQLKRISDTTVAYYVDSVSLQINAVAPLNP